MLLEGVALGAAFGILQFSPSITWSQVGSVWCSLTCARGAVFVCDCTHCGSMVANSGCWHSLSDMLDVWGWDFRFGIGNVADSRRQTISQNHDCHDV